MHLRDAVHDALATDSLDATDDMAAFGTHPYKPFSALARGFPDSHDGNQHSAQRDLDLLQAGESGSR
jgi:hypothetical protein